MTLGQRIQELRKQAGLSQEALGEALGVSRQAVSKWEGDNGIPELDTLIAMSRLFGITVGQLLGVEEPAPAATESAPAMDEEKVEAILRRYVDESRQHETPRRPAFWPWLVAICCVLAVVIVTVISVGQVREVKQSVNTLWTNVVDIENTVSNVRNQIGGLTDDVRDQISSALESEYNLISTFEYEVCSFDLKAETVNVRFFSTLKTYTAGSQVQFVLNWKQVDGTAGQTVTEAVDGPDFITWITIPMNFHLDVTIRVLLPDGTIQEQLVDTIYSGMHPDNFSFDVVGIFAPLALDRITWYGAESIKGSGWVYIYGSYPDWIWPVSVSVKYVLTNPKNESDKTEETFDLELTNSADGLWNYGYRLPQDWTVSAGAEFEATLTLVDNLGRTFVFTGDEYVDHKGSWSDYWDTSEGVEIPVQLEQGGSLK